MPHPKNVGLADNHKVGGACHSPLATAVEGNWNQARERFYDDKIWVYVLEFMLCEDLLKDALDSEKVKWLNRQEKFGSYVAERKEGKCSLPTSQPTKKQSKASAAERRPLLAY